MIKYLGAKLLSRATNSTFRHKGISEFPLYSICDTLESNVIYARCRPPIFNFLANPALKKKAFIQNSVEMPQEWRSEPHANLRKENLLKSLGPLLTEYDSDRLLSFNCQPFFYHLLNEFLVKRPSSSLHCRVIESTAVCDFNLPTDSRTLHCPAVFGVASAKDPTYCEVVVLSKI